MNRHIAERPTVLPAADVDGWEGALTPAELATVLARFGRTRGPRGFSTAEAQAVADWANEARVGEVLLRMLLAGRVAVDVHGGAVIFSEVPR